MVLAGAEFQCVLVDAQDGLKAWVAVAEDGTPLYPGGVRFTASDGKVVAELQRIEEPAPRR